MEPPKDSSICIGYWQDEGGDKLYSVNYCSDISHILGIKTTCYEAYVYMMNWNFVKNKNNGCAYVPQLFSNLDAAMAYTNDMNQKVQTMSGIYIVGDFGYPIPKEVKLRVFK